MKRTLIVAALCGAVVLFASNFAAIADAAHAFAITTCSTAAACIGGTNNGTGPGVSGTSKKSSGVIGTTAFASTPSKSAAGITGEDVSKSGVYDEGVLGTSNLGIGVVGNTNRGVGGVYGQTFNPSKTTGTVTAGVVGSDASNDGGNLNVGVFGQSTLGTAVVGSSQAGTGVYARGLPALTLVPAASAEQDLLLGFSGAFANTSRLDSNGNLYLSGEIYTAGSCSAGCATVKTATGKKLVAYHPREASPSIEDFGTGRLVAGRATIALDPSFAATLDGRRPYLVFLTPRGDNRGLYVTNTTGGRFDVRESQGGRSTLDFDYRIVGKPIDTDAGRLPEAHMVVVGPAKAKPR